MAQVLVGADIAIYITKTTQQTSTLHRYGHVATNICLGIMTAFQVSLEEKSREEAHLSYIIYMLNPEFQHLGSLEATHVEILHVTNSKVNEIIDKTLCCRSG